MSVLHLRVAEINPPFVGHLQEKQVGQLLDIVAVVDRVVAEGVAEAPKFCNDVGHAAIAWLSCLTSSGSFGPKTL